MLPSRALSHFPAKAKSRGSWELVGKQLLLRCEYVCLFCSLGCFSNAGFCLTRILGLRALSYPISQTSKLKLGEGRTYTQGHTVTCFSVKMNDMSLRNIEVLMKSDVR